MKSVENFLNQDQRSTGIKDDDYDVTDLDDFTWEASPSLMSALTVNWGDGGVSGRKVDLWE